MNSIANQSAYDQLVMSRPKVVVKFFRPSCSHCQAIAPVYANLAMTYPGVTFGEVNMEDPTAMQVGTAIGFEGVPFFRLFRNGSVVNDLTGPSAQELQDAVFTLNASQ